MSDRRTLPLAITLDGRAVDCETTCMWAGPSVLAFATTLPEMGLAVDVRSTFVSHPGVPTCATYLTLGPVGHLPAITVVEYEHANLYPIARARKCAYEHAQIVLQTLKDLGYTVGVDVPENAFEELERVER